MKCLRKINWFLCGNFTNMKLNIAFFVIFTVLYSCKKNGKILNSEKQKNYDIVNTEKPDYTTFKKSIILKKAKLKEKSFKEKSNFLYRLVNDEIYPYWKGTSWDFNGTTQKPQDGAIACGYFITNTLTDLGFKIERTKLAQAVSSKMINELCVDVERFSTIENLEKYLKTQPNNSVFIVGLDFHTGYILKDSTENYFLHSNYIDRKGVMKEKIKESSALNSSKSFMIGNLSNNKKLIENWINNK